MKERRMKQFILFFYIHKTSVLQIKSDIYMKNIKPFPVYSQSEERQRTAELWAAQMPLKISSVGGVFQISFSHGILFPARFEFTNNKD